MQTNKELVVDVLSNTVVNHNPSPGLIFHSDRGSQYASDKVVKIPKAGDFRQSMSGKSDCFDNAMMESFFASLKKELIRLETFSLNYKITVEYYIETTQT